jgi:ACS family hexuronate transporter-like MFS transporter
MHINHKGESQTAEPTLRADRWAWGICWLMFASTVLNYMDRQTVSLVRPQIRETFGITADVDFGWILSAFMMTYALFQVPAGYLVDRYDLRRAYALAVAGWSLAAVATALAPGLGALIACRALLGIGESFNWPCALRVTGRILPQADRSLGNGIFNSGAAVGAVVTPLVVTSLTQAFGWRAAFFVIGAAGIIWVVAWLVLVQGRHRQMLAAPKPAPIDESLLSPHRSRLSGPVRGAFLGALVGGAAVALSALWFGPSAIWLGIALAMIGPLVVAALIPLAELKGAEWAAGLGEIVRLRRFWSLVVVSVSINICWHFLINWIPTFLKEERGLSYQASNFLSAIPFLAADAGNLGGGWLSRRLAARGLSPRRARQLVMIGCAVLIQTNLGVAFARGDAAVLVLLSVAAAATAAFMANYFAFAQEVSVPRTGLVVGYLGAIGNIFVAGFQPFAGKVKDLTGSFSLVFVIIALVPLLGIAALLLAWPRQNGDQGKAAVANLGAPGAPGDDKLD